MKRIAIIGKARSGKSTALDFIIKEYKKMGLKVLHYDVSHALYPITETLFPESVYGENKDRSKLQLVGQTIRQYDPDFWINAMHNAILNDNTVSDYVDVLIVTGVRQPNEYQYLRNHSFKIIKIESLDQSREKRAIKENDIDFKNTFIHETEKHVDKFKADYTIANFSTKKAFYCQLNMLL